MSIKSLIYWKNPTSFVYGSNLLSFLLLEGFVVQAKLLLLVNIKVLYLEVLTMVLLPLSHPNTTTLVCEQCADNCF